MGRGRDCPVGIVTDSFWGRSIMSFKTFLCGFIIFLIVDGFSWLMRASLTCGREGQRGKGRRIEGKRMERKGERERGREEQARGRQMDRCREGKEKGGRRWY